MIFWLWFLLVFLSSRGTTSNLVVPCSCLPLGSVPTCICCLLFHIVNFPLSFPYVGANAPELAHRKLNAKQCPGHLCKSRVLSFFLVAFISSEISQQSASVSGVILKNADSLACRRCPNCLCSNGHFSASSLPRALVGYMVGLLGHFPNFQSLFSCLSFLSLVISLVDFPSPLIEFFCCYCCLIPRAKKILPSILFVGVYIKGLLLFF